MNDIERNIKTQMFIYLSRRTLEDVFSQSLKVENKVIPNKMNNKKDLNRQDRYDKKKLKFYFKQSSLGREGKSSF